jgi:hypothetical protein
MHGFCSLNIDLKEVAPILIPGTTLQVAQRITLDAAFRDL